MKNKENDSLMKKSINIFPSLSFQRSGKKDQQQQRVKTFNDETAPKEKERKQHFMMLFACCNNCF